MARRPAIFAALILGIGLGWWAIARAGIGLEDLRALVATLDGWRVAEPVAATLAAFAIYVAVTALSLPLGIWMTLGIGALFGFWWGLAIVSFASTIGIAAVLFNHVFDFPASDPSTMLIGFVFLVALGIDYSIFLMTRVREEVIKQGTHPGILKGLSATGGVITSAGVVLAATFAALGVIPLVFLAQIGFIVAFGVLLDTFVVRSLLVPALSHDIGRWIWWPGKLYRELDHADAETEEMLHPHEA